LERRVFAARGEGLVFTARRERLTFTARRERRGSGATDAAVFVAAFPQWRSGG
jgi:hypothetical protein